METEINLEPVENIGQEVAEVTVHSLSIRKSWVDPSKDIVTAAFGKRTDTGDDVFITGKCASSVKLKVGDTLDFNMGLNDKWQSGESNCKWFAFYAYLDEDEDEQDADLHPDDMKDLFDLDYTGKRTYVKRDDWIKKAVATVDEGGVWNSLTLTNSLLGSHYTTTAGMAPKDKTLHSTINTHLQKRHVDGEIARVDIRRSADQQKASHVFYTAHPERLSAALRGSK